MSWRLVMSKKNFVYEVSFAIGTRAFATLNREFDDIPIEQLIKSMTKDEIDDATQHENFNLYEDALEAIRHYRWVIARGKKDKYFLYQIDSIEEEPPF